MAPFPRLWRCLGCRTFIPVDPDTGHNVRWPQGFVEIWCECCKTWGEPVPPNGRA